MPKITKTADRSSRSKRHRLAPLASLALLISVGSLTACDPPPPSGVVVPQAAWADEMLASVNSQRAAVGVGPLVLCGSLMRSAQGHSEDQAAMNTMTHTGSNGSNFIARDEAAGYLNWTNASENVAAGYTSVSAVMAGWMASPGHRSNILKPQSTHLGVGQATSTSGRQYWTQSFGRDGTC